MSSIYSIDKAFEAMEEIKVGISKCDSKYTMRNVKNATLYGDMAYYEAGEDPEKTVAIRERIDQLIDEFDNECVCHRL